MTEIVSAELSKATAAPGEEVTLTARIKAGAVGVPVTLAAGDATRLLRLEVTEPAPAAWVAVRRPDGAVRRIDAVNPTAASNPPGAPYPGFRGPNQLLLITQDHPPFNQWGRQLAVGPDGVVVDAGVVVARPSGGYVLSGHGTAADWLAGVLVRTRVELLTEVPGPGPTPAPSGDRTVAIYSMSGSMTALPPECNQMRVSFLQGTDLVEWRGDTRAAIHARANGWKAGDPGRRGALLSLGGSGGQVDMARIVASVRAVEAKMPLDGIDWDIEGGALDVSRAVAASVELAKGREDRWVTAFTPPGGPPVALYLDAAKRCRAAGLRVQFGQQLYDTRIVQADVMRQTALAVQSLGAEQVLLGCMVGTDPAKYSTALQWEGYLRAVRGEWPGIGGAYLWESSRAGTADWARRMAGVLA